MNPETKRPYPVGVIEKSLKQAHFSVNPNKNNKQQALVAIKKLQSILPIERAQMRLRVICHKKHTTMLKEMSTEVEEEKVHDDGKLEIVSI